MKRKLLAFLLGACLVLNLAGCGVLESTTEKMAENIESELESESVMDDFDPIELFDDDYCTAAITAYNETTKTLTAEVINNSTQVIIFSVYSAVVNGVEVETSCHETLKKSEDTTIDIEFYEDADLGDYTQIKLTVQVYDPDTLETLAEKTLTLYPYGQDAATEYERVVKTEDKIIIDNDYAEITVTGYGENEDTFEVDVYIINKSGTSVVVSADNEEINGEAVSSYWSTSIDAGNQRFSTISFDLSETTITNILSVQFDILINEEETWEEYVNETIVLDLE